MSARQSDNIQETIPKSKNQKFIFPFTSSPKNNTQTNCPLQHLVPLKDFAKSVLFKRYIDQIMNRIRRDQRGGCLRERDILPLHIKPGVQSRFVSFLRLQEEDVSENEIFYLRPEVQWRFVCFLRLAYNSCSLWIQNLLQIIAVSHKPNLKTSRLR